MANVIQSEKNKVKLLVKNVSRYFFLTYKIYTHTAEVGSDCVI